MEIQPDFREWAELLNAHEVEYLIVGSMALAHHGAPRATGVIDFLVRPSAENAPRVLKALDEFGFGSLGFTVEDLTNLHNVIQLGYQPVRIDIITSITGVSWEEAWQGRDQGNYGGVPVYYLGKREFIMNKRASGRKKDLADLEELGEE
ncbi:MAG: hypothetical protein C4524_12370 [Candidatus Zixiibacteriota bacterium]|nr:MAG: hypothetical protein C4524_12370 [candidate division Zixibacteria bacterium]